MTAFSAALKNEHHGGHRTAWLLPCGVAAKLVFKITIYIFIYLFIVYGVNGVNIIRETKSPLAFPFYFAFA